MPLNDALERNKVEIRPLLGMAEFETIQTPQTKAISDCIRAKLDAA